MIDGAAIETIERHVDDALAKGATRLGTAGSVAAGRQYATSPVLGGATTNMRLASEETFGPVAPIFRFDDEAEAIDIADATPLGLAADFFTEGSHRACRMAEALDFGMIGANTGSISTEVAPFGGVKQSGFGPEGSRLGIDEYIDVKSLHIAGPL